MREFSRQAKDSTKDRSNPGRWNPAYFRRKVPAMDIWLTIRSFIAFYLLLFGLGYMSGASDQRVVLGSFFAALGLVFFWRLWIAMRTGK